MELECIYEGRLLSEVTKEDLALMYLFSSLEKVGNIID